MSALYDIAVKAIDGTDTTLADHEGDVMLIVNVASKCGLTPQYDGLEKLHETYRDRGFTVLGFPANDFAGQEPGSNAEISEFCRTNFGVQFPMYSKIAVTGPGKHPLYRHLTAEKPDAEGREGMESSLRKYGMEANPRPEVVWNFEKFLVNREGDVVHRFSPDTPPDSPALKTAIEQALG